LDKVKFMVENVRKRFDPKAIVNYWISRVGQDDLNINLYHNAHERCWRCATKCKPEQAHIIPHALGGPSDPSNLVLLCNQCHKENPNTSNADLFWQWMKASTKIRIPGYENVLSLSPYCYGNYWIIRKFREYIDIYGEDPIKEMALINDLIYKGDSEAFWKDYGDFITDKFVTDGQRFSPSTSATLLKWFLIEKGKQLFT
jgi:hypothetical protein